ncbi:hypothetical protein Xoosp13_119 [Xanthomonas phage Xoo-sp13]|nr:hypothetical protein Xoosp13_119 [Xanthomonas phage Xoo-sp13]
MNDLPFIVEGMLGKELSQSETQEVAQMTTLFELEGFLQRELSNSERQHLKGWLS